MKRFFIITFVLACIVSPVTQVRADVLNQNNQVLQQLLAQIEVLKAQLQQLLDQQQGGKTTPACIFTRTLSLGAQGNDVVCLQTYLKKKGHLSGTITGFYGPQTKNAVYAWQQSKQIIPEPKAIGMFGPRSQEIVLRDMQQVPRMVSTTTSTSTTKVATTKHSKGGGGGGGGNSRTNESRPVEKSIQSNTASTTTEKALPQSVPEPVKVTNKKIFKVFDSVGGYKGKPDTTNWGLKPITILYGTNFGDGSNYVEPSEAKTRKAARVPISTSTDNIVVLDIEHWSTASSAVQDTVRKYNQVADWVKSENSEIKIGYYGLPPKRNYWDAVSASTTRKNSWHSENDSLAPMVAHVDALFPSLYTFYNDVPGWVTYAKENIAEAKRLSGGKPVYPYIWFRYHDSSALKGQYIDSAYWQTELQTIKDAGADGVVIWGYGASGVWDDNAPWINTTKTFVSGLSMNQETKNFAHNLSSQSLTSAEVQVNLNEMIVQLKKLREQVKELK